jgi:SAM-dependent methyltransferase
MESARDANDRFAPIYDAWNAQNNYEMWLGELLLPELEKRGLRRGWALDVGCATGRAFNPLLDRGWQLVGCDVSPGMLAEARRKFGSRVQLLGVDARGLPAIRPFQLVLLLNDVSNYLTEDGDLEKVFASARRNLSHDRGLLVFDANTLALFRKDYASAVIVVSKEGWEWHGLSDEIEPEGIYEGRFSGPDLETHLHRQRHWSTAQVTKALEASGLRCLAALGQREEGSRILLSDSADEERDAKVVYIATHAA